MKRCNIPAFTFICLLCVILTSCEIVLFPQTPPDPNCVTSFGQVTCELRKDDSLKDMCDAWEHGKVMTIEDGSNGADHVKTVFDILSKEGWSDFDSVFDVEADFIIDTTQQDGIAIRYIIDFETGRVEVCPIALEYHAQPCISKKTLSNDDIDILKDLVYYYFAQQSE